MHFMYNFGELSAPSYTPLTFKSCNFAAGARERTSRRTFALYKNLPIALRALLLR